MNNFFKSLQILKTDKVCLALSFAPVFIGVLLYFFLGNFIYGDLKDWVHALITKQINSETWGTVLYYLLMSLVWILILFIINWTFVLVVSVIASPFNDMLSERCEKLVRGEKPQEVLASFKEKIKSIVKIIANEMKKLTFIIALSFLALILNFFPLFTPISIFLTALLMAINFLDYSWSRHHLSLSQCLNDLKKNVWIYSLAGLAFVFLMTMPVLNLLMLPLGVIFFTVAFVPQK